MFSSLTVLTVALYTTPLVKQEPLRGHSIFFRQLLLMEFAFISPFRILMLCCLLIMLFLSQTFELFPEWFIRHTCKYSLYINVGTFEFKTFKIKAGIFSKRKYNKSMHRCSQVKYISSVCTLYPIRNL